jgi:hypothetical protein
MSQDGTRSGPDAGDYPEPKSIGSDSMPQIKPKTIIDSPVTGSKFRVADVLGQGGFGSPIGPIGSVRVGN